MEGITIVSQSTKERNKETKELFNQIKPLLDKGMIYSKAIKIVKGLPEDYSLTRRAWYHDLLNYGESQGYPYKNHSGKSRRM